MVETGIIRWQKSRVVRSYGELSSDLRYELAAYIQQHIEQVVEYVKQIAFSASRSFTGDDHFDAEAEIRLAALMVAEWLISSWLPDEENLELLASVGRRFAKTGDLAQVVRGALACRDGVCELIMRFCYLKSVPYKKADGLLVGVRMACDALLVRMARNFDCERHALQEELATRKTELELMALHDPLTGIPNRALLLDRLEGALSRMARHPERGTVAVFFLDLDDFKALNDRYGHRLGDEILQTVARRLSTQLRGEDTVSRLGGDEFVVVAEGIEDESTVEALARRISRIVSQPIIIGGRPILITASTGAKVIRDPACKPAEIIEDADGMMYRAKTQGGGAYLLDY